MYFLFGRGITTGRLYVSFFNSNNTYCLKGNVLPDGPLPISVDTQILLSYSRDLIKKNN